MPKECICKFKEKCWAHLEDGCKMEPSRYMNCYEYMKYEYMGDEK